MVICSGGTTWLHTTELRFLRTARQSRSAVESWRFQTIPLFPILKETEQDGTSGQPLFGCLTEQSSAPMAENERFTGTKSLPEKKPSLNLATGFRNLR